MVIPPISVEFILKLTLSLLLGGLVGLERSLHNKAAGFRTMMLICMAATLFVRVGKFLVDSPEIYGQVNMAVIIGNAITGIGFLGAGSIIRSANGEPNKYLVEGLTTAATIWFVTGIGFLVGIGLFWHAILAAVYSLSVLVFFSHFERRLLNVIRSRNIK